MASILIVVIQRGRIRILRCRRFRRCGASAERAIKIGGVVTDRRRTHNAGFALARAAQYHAKRRNEERSLPSGVRKSTCKHECNGPLPASILTPAGGVRALF